MRHYISLMRPKQWIKNLAVLVGPAFAHTFDLPALKRTAVVFAAFCLISSASYAVNDFFDRKADALHPQKKSRPLASGAISAVGCVACAFVLLAASVLLSARYLPLSCTLIILGYFLMILAYSFGLKRRMILDVVLIAIGFVLRTTAGANAVGAFVSPWLIVCTFTLCMFMGFGKRRCEIDQFESLEEAGQHRKTLARYTPELLNNLISVSAGITIMTFLLYTMDKDTPSTFPKEHLMFTLPLVVYGVFRYSMLVQSGNLHGPMDIVLHDRAFQGTVVVWTLVAAAIVFEDRLIEMEIFRAVVGEALQP